MTDTVKLLFELPVSADRVYKDWLSSKGHSAFTGSSAKIAGKLNSDYSCYDGYILGKILELDKNNRILATWRTHDFLDNDKDSLLEILFHDIENHCQITIHHNQIPSGEGDKYRDGWNEYYIKPMKEFYKYI